MEQRDWRFCGGGTSDWRESLSRDELFRPSVAEGVGGGGEVHEGSVGAPQQSSRRCDML